MVKPQSLGPDQREELLSESWLARGWADTKDWLGRWQFWAAEVFVAWGVSRMTPDATSILLIIFGLAFLVWLVATGTAPWRQRNEAREVARSFYTPRIHVAHKATKPVSFKDADSKGEALLFLTVSNRGQPTSLTDWTVESVGSGFQVRTRRRPTFSYRFSSPERIGLRFEIQDSESIQNKTFLPIPTGGIVSGIFSIGFAGRKFAEIIKDEPEASITLKFTDAFGERHELRIRLRDQIIQKDDFPSVPGIAVELIRDSVAAAPQVQQSLPATTDDLTRQQPSQD